MKIKSLTEQMREAVRHFVPMPEPVRAELVGYCEAKRDDAVAALGVLAGVDHVAEDKP